MNDLFKDTPYSETIGSFIRNGNYPLEAHYIFPTEEALKEFYSDEVNITTIHKGLLKIVENDGTGKQALYWVTKKQTNDELEFTKLISGTNIDSIFAQLDDLNAHKQDTSNPHRVTKAQVGLGNVTNDPQITRSEKGVANGVATLDAKGKVPTSQLPSYVDDIIDVYATYSKSDTGVLSNVTLYLDAAHTKLVTGEKGKIYQNIADGEPQYQFRWTGTIFSQTGASSLILGEVTGTAYDGAKGKANADNIAKIKGTSLSHIKDAAPVTTAADKVSINYESYEGNQYGAAGTDHTADIPAATTAKAGVMSAADKVKLDDTATSLANHKANNDKKHIPAGGHERQILAWESDGTAKWDDLANMFTGLEELLAYGVEWKEYVSDPHLTRIGNMSLHKTLPIQSLLKGCIAQGEKVMYWLDENDWRFKKDPTIIPYTSRTESSIIYSESISGLLTEGMYIKVLYPNSKYIVGLGRVLSVSNGEVYFDWETPGAKWEYEMKYDIEIGSRLDGYDGTVRVYCPSFYIKSQIIGNTRRVWISTVKIDNTWLHQRAILIDAYRSTILHTVPENMGYLSSLPVNSAVSIVNTSDYCRGGSNRASYDQYLKGSSTVTKDICKTDLGKPITGLSRPTMRTYSRNAGSEMLSYNLYKNIFYWLYVIEYANFNCQEAYTSTLTTEGYHLGGLGDGVTTFEWSAWSLYNGTNPLTPCGYGNNVGNKTNISKITCGTETFNVPRWRGFDNPFGDIYTILEGVVVKCEAYRRPSFFYTTDDVSEYSDVVGNKTIAGIECTGLGFIREFDLGTTAEIIPSDHGGAATTYKCDYHCSGLDDEDSSHYGTIRVPWVGGAANYAEAGGIGRIDVDYPVSDSWSGTGFRTISFCDSENQLNK